MSETLQREFEVMQPEKANGQELVARSPMDLMQIALSHQAGIEVIERLAALQEKQMARESEIDFNEALNRIQQKIKRIAPDLENPQKHSRYASYAAIDRVIRPIYSAEGMSLSFTHADCPKPDHIRVICRCALRGHKEMYQVDWPVDTKGPKGEPVMTATQATGASDSYAKRYLVKDIFNISIGETDDDGNGQAATASRLPDERYLQLRDGIEGAGNLAELDRLYKAALTEAGDDAESKSDFSKAKNKRYRELHNAGR